MKIEHTHCCYCRRKFNDDIEQLTKTKDHFIPTSRSGNNNENVLECCYECNQWKADRMPEYWLNRVEYFQNRKTKHGTYTLIDYKQIIGSIRHWKKFFKGKSISEYKY